MAPVETIELQHVFVLSGIPTYTFVQPVEYPRLLVAIRTPGRSIVIEGPSGIGKTTAAVKAIEEAGLTSRVLTLTPRRLGDVELIDDLPNQLPIGTVVIDDFHRLPTQSKQRLADLMKVLADEGATHSKLIVLGIPNAGQSLIVFGRDLANRIEIIPFEANPEFKVEQLIIAGETALNIHFNIKDEIVRAAQGSFYIAQMLAHHTCIRSGILSAKSETRSTSESYESVKTNVMATLSRSFRRPTISFVRGTKLRREGRAPYLHLLYWLGQSANWSINVAREADRHPGQKVSVSQVITKGYLTDLISSSSEIENVLHFDVDSQILVAQDPQFVYYIRNMSWPQLAEEVGFLSIDFPSRYDFALSFSGTDRNIAEGLFNKLSEHEIEVFYDKNEQHRILAEDVEEYLAPIYSSDASLVVCVIGPDYPKRLWTKFESTQFRQRFKSGEVIPIVLDTVTLSAFDLASRIGYVSWDTSTPFETELDRVVNLLVRKCGEVRQKRIGVNAGPAGGDLFK